MEEMNIAGMRVYHRRRRQFGTIVSRSRVQHAFVVRLDQSGTCTVSAFATLWLDTPRLREMLADSGGKLGPADDSAETEGDG